MQRTIARRVTAEAVLTCLLLAAVVGSRIMGERLAGGNVGVALLANTIATAAALGALILTFGPISGARFNPAVTLADASQGGLPWNEVPLYLGAQVIGAFAGVAAAHLMFEVPVFSHPDAPAPGQRNLVYHRRLLVHASTSFANPCRDARPFRHRYVRGNPTGRRPGVHRRATARSGCRNWTLSLARSDAARCRSNRGRAAFGSNTVRLAQRSLTRRSAGGGTTRGHLT